MKKVIVSRFMNNAGNKVENTFVDMDGGSHFKWVRFVVDGRETPITGNDVFHVQQIDGTITDGRMTDDGRIIFDRDVLDSTHDDNTRAVFVGGLYNSIEMTVEYVRQLDEYAGDAADHSEDRRRGELCGAHIFDGAPLVIGYVGPMYGGMDTPLRYESRETYDQLSR